MAVSLHEYFHLGKMVYNPQFQDVHKKEHIRQGRYFTMLEIPGRNYSVPNLPSEEGVLLYPQSKRRWAQKRLSASMFQMVKSYKSA